MTLTYGDPNQIVNIPALLQVLVPTETNIRVLKKSLRATWTAPMAKEQMTLCSLKSRATQLCALRALCRGRYHIASRPRRGVDPDGPWDAASYNLALAKAALLRFDGLRNPALATELLSRPDAPETQMAGGKQ